MARWQAFMSNVLEIAAVDKWLKSPEPRMLLQNMQAHLCCLLLTGLYIPPCH